MNSVICVLSLQNQMRCLYPTQLVTLAVNEARSVVKLMERCANFTGDECAAYNFSKLGHNIKDETKKETDREKKIVCSGHQPQVDMTQHRLEEKWEAAAI